ncbi:MAG: Holliday junction resolvase RuvX [Chloroflexi bacterium]|nr:Holliday junction resolvase RuvX [Chloroflexota bacterium]
MRILTIDHGDKKIGLAISDESELLARPLKVLAHRSRAEDARAISQIATVEGAGRIVVGLPKNEDGEEGPQARRVRRWAESLIETCPLPVEFWDESFSTVEAAALRRNKRRGRGASRARSLKHADDAVAAAVILQSYLDARRTP